MLTQLPLHHMLSHKYKRGYTCGNCGKHWDKGSREKRHNRTSCPYTMGLFGKIRTKTKKNTDIPFVFREGDICTICQDSEDLDFRLSGCGHAFHKECLTPWVNQFATKTKEPNCPNCRKGICDKECKRLGAKVKPTTLRHHQPRQLPPYQVQHQPRQLPPYPISRGIMIHPQHMNRFFRLQELFMNNVINFATFQEFTQELTYR